ncbi:MAG: ABC transporter substrate-binding protein [Candidatus Hydrogenedentes bacterium]|nr:ABC transporter substrate-binding protein [Candidatus Hydrogenedentota bacterium]
MTTRLGAGWWTLAAGLALFAAGCGPQSATPAPRKGIITLAPHLTETVFALGQGSRVIAVGSFCDYPPEVATLPRAGGYLDPNLEKISALSPELLIVPGRDRKVAEYAEMKGLPLLSVNMDSFASIDAGIETIGKALNCVPEADALRARIRRELDDVRNVVKGLPRPKVLIITTRSSHALHNLYTANRSSFVSEMVECAGGENVYADGPTNYFAASKETIVVRMPEVVLEFHAGDNLDAAEQAKFVDDWQQLPSLPAVRNGRVYLIMESHALRPGPRVGEIARILAKRLHPEAAIPTP